MKQLLKSMRTGGGGWGPIGLDIGSHSIKAVQLPRSRADDTSEQVCHAMILPRREAPTDDAWLSEDEARRLKRSLQLQGFVGEDVIASVPRRYMIDGLFELPPVNSGAPLDMLAQQELGRAHQRDPQTLQCSWWRRPKPARASDTTHAMAVAVAISDADALIDPLDQVGLDVRVLDCPAYGLLRAIQRETLESQSIQAIVDLGHAAALLVLVAEGVVIYQRAMPQCGLIALIQEIAEKNNLEPQHIPALLRRLGGKLRADDEAPVRLQLTAMARRVSSFINHLATEVQRSLSYAQHQYPQWRVEHLWLTGGATNLKTLQQQIREQVGMTVSIYDSFARLNPQSPMDLKAIAPSFALAVGLADVDAADEQAIAS